MSEAVIVALITGLFSVIAVIVTNISSNRKIQAQLDKQQAVFGEQLKELQRRVEVHNSVIERTYELERKVSVLEEKTK